MGKFAGKDNAFLIQNVFPILAKYFDHVHTIENKPITMHKKIGARAYNRLERCIGYV